MMHQAWSVIEKVLNSFKGYLLNFKATRAGVNSWKSEDLFSTSWQIHFELMDDYEMTHTVFRSMNDLPYCFSMSFIKFEGHTVRKNFNLDPIWTFLHDNSNFTVGYEMTPIVSWSME